MIRRREETAERLFTPINRMMERMGENIEQNQKTFRANVRYRLRDALSNLKLEKHGGGNSLHNFTGLAGGGHYFPKLLK